MKKIIHTENIIKICANTIRLFDERIINHGERVAYIAYRIYETLEEKTMDLTMLLMLCIFHDVGAYKTEEMDRLLKFENEWTGGHSIYGYLFLKYFSPWEDYSEALLYHHTSYEKIKHMSGDCKEYAAMIHLCDQIDLALVYEKEKEYILKRIDSSEFCPEHVHAAQKLFDSSDFYEVMMGESKEQLDADLLSVHSLTFEESLGMLKMLVYCIDFKSHTTVAHSVTTARTAEFLARKLEVSEEVVNKIYLGALVHDIGKIATPVEILEKAGKLSQEEMVVMREHVEVSEQILSGILSPDVTAIAVRHHEKLDGSGYPRRLTADELTIEERIVGISDITSALLSKRSYKKEFSLEQVTEILKQMEEELQIDSMLTEVICKHIAEISVFIQWENEQLIKRRKDLKEEYQKLHEQWYA